MRGNDIFILFKNKSTAINIGKMVTMAGMHVASIVLNTSDLKRRIAYYGSGIIICGYMGNDEAMAAFLEDIPDEFQVVLIGTAEQIHYCENLRVHKLAVPLHRMDLICCLEMISNVDADVKRTNMDAESENLIYKAKRYLITHYAMTEEQAHRYIQKKSMDTGRKMVDIARMIVK